MKLTDELFEVGKNSKKMCTIVDDDYVLLKKSMPVVDGELEDYFASIKKASDAGINISCVEDYRLIEGTTHNYSNGISFTKGVFLERRAKGNSFEGVNFFSIDEHVDAEETIDEYLNVVVSYLEEVERRSKASDHFYDKLVKDYLGLKEFGLSVDPKPANFFYDEKDGFTIIDPIPATGHENLEFLPTHIIGAVYGYGRPFLYFNNEKFGLPKSLIDKFVKVYEVINKKIMLALRKNGIDEKLIINQFEKESYKTKCQEIVMEKEEMLQKVRSMKENKKYVG